MGTLSYNASIKADFDDRALAHLRVVIGMKLKRNESFYLSWRDDQSIGDGTTTIWINPAIPLSFKFHGSKEIAVNPRWVEELMLVANTTRGLHLTPEPDIPGGRSSS